MTTSEIRFDERVFVVTGAGRGLGRAYAGLLASRGAKVVVADNGAAMNGASGVPGAAHAVAADIRSKGGQATPCAADLATEAGSQEAIEAALQVYGRIDGILHNASTVPELRATDLLSSADLEIVMRINAFAGLWLARGAWPHMMRQGYGRMLYTTSVGIYGQEGTAPYCAAKGAMIGIMRALADEGGTHGILVNVIAPSARTRMTERFLSSAYGEWLLDTMPPEKASMAAAFLMSEACTLNGEILTLGGGRIGHMVLGESEGVIGTGASIEEAHDMIPAVLEATDFFYPKSVAERSARVAAMFGFVD